MQVTNGAAQTQSGSAGGLGANAPPAALRRRVARSVAHWPPPATRRPRPGFLTVGGAAEFQVGATSEGKVVGRSWDPCPRSTRHRSPWESGEGYEKCVAAPSYWRSGSRHTPDHAVQCLRPSPRATCRWRMARHRSGRCVGGSSAGVAQLPRWGSAWPATLRIGHRQQRGDHELDFSPLVARRNFK